MNSFFEKRFFKEEYICVILAAAQQVLRSLIDEVPTQVRKAEKRYTSTQEVFFQ